MEQPGPLTRAIALRGLINVARACKVTHQAVRRWEANGRMPRTEWTGETAYSRAIEELTGGAVKVAELLERRQVPEAESPPQAIEMQQPASATAAAS